jgi:hypothetical protein
MVFEVAVAVLAAVGFSLLTSPPAAAPITSAATPVMTSPRLWFLRGGGGGSLVKPAPLP